MAKLRCPVCEKSFDSAKSQSMPFCSPECRQVDLSRWLREEYSLPVESEDERPEEDSGGFDDDEQ